MSNDIYDDFTDEEKALLKREMKFRIEQQRQRKNPRNQLIIGAYSIGAGILFVAIGLFFSSQRLQGFRAL